MAEAQIEGIDIDAVTAWFTASVEPVTPPLRFELITGGRSNLTYEVADADGRRFVLRRPPLGQVLATAHDMTREHRIIAALADTDVPVPPARGLVEDDSVNGAPFYVMDFVDGAVIRSATDAAQLDGASRDHIGRSLVDVLARIHAVDVDAVGLGDLGRREGYVERQLKRWYGQWEKSKTRELDSIDRVHEALSASVPDQGPATIVHGDYRLDNCMIGDDGSVAAVLDWELCTLGDPLADLGLLLVYWAEPDDELTVAEAPTTVGGFGTRAEVVDRYAAATGRTVDHIDYYVAFGYWKLACIVEGVYARYAGGSMGGDGAGAEAFAAQVEILADAAAEAVDRL
ncbi:MAG: phosphotransferase family protein [Actinomycetota bacterium]